VDNRKEAPLSRYQRTKSVDKQLSPCIIRLKMSRKQKIVELDPNDLLNKSVSDLDAQLSAIWAYLSMAVGYRQHKAESENITTPPPKPPPSVFAMYGAAPQLASASTAPRINSARRAPNTLPEKTPKHVTWIAGSATHVAYTVIDKYPHGVDVAVFREEFDKAYSGDDKSATHSRALRVLKDTGHAVFYKKKLFSYDRLKQFLADVAAGVVEDIPGDQPTLNGKWAITVYNVIRDQRGSWIGFAEIVDNVIRQPGFEKTHNAESQVAVALRGLQYRHHTIEKKKQGTKPVYRLKSDDQSDEPQANGHAASF
jgi:hypothetical protein